jgi:hypothetical protein
MLDIYTLRLIIINITIIFKHSCFNITAQKIVGIGCDLNLISNIFFLIFIILLLAMDISLLLQQFCFFCSMKVITINFDFMIESKMQVYFLKAQYITHLLQ